MFAWKQTISNISDMLKDESMREQWQEEHNAPNTSYHIRMLKQKNNIFLMNQNKQCIYFKYLVVTLAC